jgi:purine-nucleoside phosphorylase
MTTIAPIPPGHEARTAAAHLTYRLEATPRVAVVLGSGLGAFADGLADAHPVAYADIPHFPVPTAPGHSGRLVFGFVGEVPVVVMQGRVHLYEGLPVEDVTFGVRVFAALGVRTLLLTTASGGIHRHHEPGDFMVIEDQLNLQGVAPPKWLTAELANRPGAALPGAGEPLYDPRLVAAALEVARQSGLRGVHRGVFCGLRGPTYETPAEIRMLERLGADAVSMSTVWSAQVTRALGLRVAGVSVIANKAAGLHVGELNHVDVLAVMERTAPVFVDYLNALVPALDAVE